MSLACLASMAEMLLKRIIHSVGFTENISKYLCALKIKKSKLASRSRIGANQITKLHSVTLTRRSHKRPRIFQPGWDWGRDTRTRVGKIGGCHTADVPGCKPAEPCSSTTTGETNCGKCT